MLGTGLNGNSSKRKKEIEEMKREPDKNITVFDFLNKMDVDKIVAAGTIHRNKNVNGDRKMEKVNKSLETIVNIRRNKINMKSFF
jgi:hypothetical protein